jgi:lipoate-protein ligase A
MNWQFEYSGKRSGFFNMRRDETLAQRVARGLQPPTLRIYGWDPPAISLGWNQSPDAVDREAAQRAGLDVVRRPTGGRAILHDDEATYCVTMPAQGRSIHKTYRQIGEALVSGLRHLGVDAAMEQQQADFSLLSRTSSAGVCFASSARYEICIAGKKLIGSAQRRFAVDGGEDVVLQHGSLLLGPAHKRLVDVLNLPQTSKQAVRTALEEKTIDLRTIMGRSVRMEDVADSLRRGFEDVWGIWFETTVGDVGQQTQPL